MDGWDERRMRSEFRPERASGMEDRFVAGRRLAILRNSSLTLPYSFAPRSRLYRIRSGEVSGDVSRIAVR